MKTDFENWLDKQLYIQEYQQNIFKDAVSCFKYGIIRPALMLSYVGFMYILRDRVLTSTAKPSPFPEDQWNKMLKDLKNDRIWEETLMNAIQSQVKRNGGSIEKASIFNIDDDIRREVIFWKDRRNDCAHYKMNDITEAHVLAFWAFIKSKLSYITIEGGYDSLLNKFKVFFDRSLTPPGSDIKPLLDEINIVVDDEHWPDFVANICSYAMDSNYILHNLLHTTHKKVIDKTASYIAENKEVLCRYLSENPSDIGIIPLNPDRVRSLWYKDMRGYSRCIVPLYAELLNAGLIPHNEIDEANKHILTMCAEFSYFIGSPNQYQVNILKSNNFYQTFVEEYINEKYMHRNYQRANGYASFYQRIIECFGIDHNVVKALTTYIKDGNNYPYTVVNFLNTTFSNDEKLRNEFIEIADSNGYEIHRSLIER